MQYQITVQGQIDASWSAWFNGLVVTSATSHANGAITTLSGQVADQAALRGILNHLWDLNLTILSVIQLEPQGEQESSRQLEVRS